MFRSLMARRDAKVASAAAAVAGVVLLAAQTSGDASASTRTQATSADKCQQQPASACLWLHGKDLGPKDALIIRMNPNGLPDLEEKTPNGLGLVRGMSSRFTDNISVGYNGLPVALCLFSTTEVREEGRGNKVAVKDERQSEGVIFPVEPEEGFAQLGEYNDTFDWYTTAKPGGCPSYIRFKPSNGYVLDRHFLEMP
jgi:hypothetical protein